MFACSATLGRMGVPVCNAGAPVLDTLLATGFLVGTGVAVNNVGNGGYYLLVPAGFFALSAALGFLEVRSCKAAIREHEQAELIDCATIRATAVELRARGGGTIRDAKFVNSARVQSCLLQPQPQPPSPTVIPTDAPAP